MSVAVIDYGSGNLRSVTKALERAARESGANMPVVLTSDPDVVRRADRIVLPGVGAFADCRAGLDRVAGMVEMLHERVRDGGTPFLGICVGEQLMASRGLEKVETEGLDWISGDVVRVRADGLKLPQIGWNTLDVRRSHPLLSGIEVGPQGLHAYFVHSFHMRCVSGAVIATAAYGEDVTAIVARDNMVGTQFHPEKSQTLGLALLANFLEWSP